MPNPLAPPPSRPPPPPPIRMIPLPLPANDYEPDDLLWLATLLLAEAFVQYQEEGTP